MRVPEPHFVVSADGTAIAVWRSGAGPPLVLVHGTVADHGRWAPVLPAFEAQFTILNLDRRGRGQSGDAPEYSLEREYEDLVAVIESLDDDVYVLGHSYGGVCALEAALRTDRILKLVLYEPPLSRHLAGVAEPMIRGRTIGGIRRHFERSVSETR